MNPNSEGSTVKLFDPPATFELLTFNTSVHRVEDLGTRRLSFTMLAGEDHYEMLVRRIVGMTLMPFEVHASGYIITGRGYVISALRVPDGTFEVLIEARGAVACETPGNPTR
jgi:hypothetical protein